MENIETTLSDPGVLERYRATLEAVLLAGGALTEVARTLLEQRAIELGIHRLDVEQILAETQELPSVQAAIATHAREREQHTALLAQLHAVQAQQQQTTSRIQEAVDTIQLQLHNTLAPLEQRLGFLEQRCGDLTAALGRLSSLVMLRLPDGTELAPIPAGAFMMGSDDRSEEQPIHQVTLDAYYIYRTPVTVEQYQRFCTATGTDMPPAPRYNADWQQQDHPIVNVSWEDATAYCRWLSGETGLGVALPTEAQWEKAARGTDGQAYPWGNQWDASRLRCSLQSSGDAGGTAPVGSYWGGVSPYGVLDMAGNVWEWCQDWYDAGYYAVSPSRNPTGPETGQKRVLRGGSWHFSNPYDFRCANRTRLAPAYGVGNLGFRCVVRAEAP